MIRPVLMCCLSLVVAAPVLAQQSKAAPPPPPTTPVGVTRVAWERAISNITRSADQMPDSLFGFKPTPDVRSFGQLIGHVTGSQMYYCAAALGETPSSEDIEKTKTTKADLVAALKVSNELCTRAYAQSEADALKPMSSKSPAVRFSLLVGNVAHVNEHYGNLVTYLRLKGMVPPSSQRGMQ